MVRKGAMLTSSMSTFVKPVDALLFLLCIASTCVAQSVEDWLRTHQASNFTGQVYARFRIDEPKNIAYAVIIDSETNPYGPMRQATGTIWATGLQAKPWKGDKDWGKPLAWIEPKQDSAWLRAGQVSAWAKLPTSKASQWHTAFFVRTRDKKPPPDLRLHIDFASAPQASDVFHHTVEAVDESGAVAVRMPTTGGEAGLRMVQSFGQWAQARAARVDSLKLGSPPHLKKLRINTWVQLQTYRWLGANATRDRAEPDFHNFELLGINDLSLSGVDDVLFRDLASQHQILFASRTAWAGNWAYTTENYSHQYDFRVGETPQQRWARVLDDYYRKLAAADEKQNPFAFSIADHINLGDEVGAVTTPAEIINTAAWLADFHSWLREKHLEPTDLGAAGWKDVRPVDDRAPLAEGNLPYARLFYYTRRYVDQQTAIFYRCATEAIRKYYPKPRVITVNFQAGPMQCAYIGNSNDFDKGQLDLFELGRSGFQGAMTEDWVNGATDWGISRISMGAQILAAAARKRGDPTASYVVGGEAIRAECMANLMHGVKELVLYLYGPIQNIGPVWSENPKALREVAAFTRELKPLEDAIVAARPRPAKTAFLVASTSDIMQVQGRYFLAERQQLYLALAHAGLPVDIICEQEVLEDGILDRYEALYLVDPQTQTAALEKIAAWVKAGGHFWACVGAGQWDEFNQKSAVLNPVFGVSERAMILQPGGLKPIGALWQTNLSRFDYQMMASVRYEEALRPRKRTSDITAWGAKLKCMPASAEVIASYDDGSPAILRNRFGKGQAVLAGTLAGEAYARAYYKDSPREGAGSGVRDLIVNPFDQWEPAGRILSKPPGIYTSVMDGPNATLLFLNNASGKALAKVELELAERQQPKRIRSAKRVQVALQPAGDRLQLTLPLENSDILVLEH